MVTYIKHRPAPSTLPSAREKRQSNNDRDEKSDGNSFSTFFVIGCGLIVEAQLVYCPLLEATDHYYLRRQGQLRLICSMLPQALKHFHG